MFTLGIIPARYASTRFPGKPLTLIQNKPMIQHVWEQVIKAKLDEVIVATDDKRIERTVIDFGGRALMTSPGHGSGTERCAEVMKTLKHNENSFDVIINIQGDEPFMDPKQIDLVASCFTGKEVQIATLAKKIEKENELFDANVVKVITDINDRAIYFSRQTIPFLRGREKKRWIQSSLHYKHIGIYGYRSTTLQEIVQLSKTPLEEAEDLEQLRWPDGALINTYKSYKKQDTTAWSIIKLKYKNQPTRYVGGIIPPDPENPMVLHLGEVLQTSICNVLTRQGPKEYRKVKHSFDLKELQLKDMSAKEIYDKYKMLESATVW